MKKIFLQSFILSFAGFVIFISCKKDKEDNAPKTTTLLITTGKWKHTGYTSTPEYDWYGTDFMRLIF